MVELNVWDSHAFFVFTRVCINEVQLRFHVVIADVKCISVNMCLLLHHFYDIIYTAISKWHDLGDIVFLNDFFKAFSTTFI